MFPSEFTGFGGGSLALLVLAGMAGAAWIAVLTWRWLATFPYLPDAAPPSADLGDEPPAVVNLLVHRWRLTRSALGATLLDLAARRLLAVEQYGGQVVIRAYPERAGEQRLASYEKQLLDHVLARVRLRSAPAEALALDEGEADRFWKRFSRAVVDDARHRGLARSRWTMEDRALLSGLLAGALGCLALSFSTAGLGAGSGEEDLGPLEWFAAAAIAWVAVNGFIFTRRDVRDTPEGKAVCSRWLGLRDYLRSTHAFGDLPAAAVTVWDRYLPYGVATGVAHRAVEDLPFATEDPGSAWSRHRGDWRELRVEYPSRLGAGQSPGSVALSGLWQSALFGGLAFFALPLLLRFAWDVGSEIINDPAVRGEDLPIAWIVGGLLGLAGLAAAVLLVRFAIGIAWLYRGLADLGQPETIEGEVVKVHGGRIAIDHGQGDEVIAWTPPAGTPELRRGMLLRVTKTRRLHYVSRVEVLSLPETPELESSAAAADHEMPGGGLARVDAAFIRQLTGLDLRPGGSAAAGLVAFADDGGNRVLVAVHELPPVVAGLLEGVIGRALGLTSEAGQSGPEEVWTGDRLALHTAQGLITVTVELEGVATGDRLAIARAIAGQITGEGGG